MSSANAASSTSSSSIGPVVIDEGVCALPRQHSGVCALRMEELARRGEPNKWSRPMLASSSSSILININEEEEECVRVSREARPRPPRVNTGIST